MLGGYQLMLKLSLCMIAKDEAAMIGRCLASVRAVADEIIVVDTGSSDTTAEIARQLGAHVSHYPWNDHFSAARNYSLELATGEWILVLDADETLDVKSLEVLKQVLAHDEPVEGYFLKLINYVPVSNWVEKNPGMVFRLFRNKKDYRFQGAIHEQIVNTINAINPQAKIAIREDLQILHYGYFKNDMTQKEKRQKYLNLIDHELNQDPENRLLRFQYGEELFHAGRHQEAIKALAQAGEGLDPQIHFMPKLLRTIILSYMTLRQFDAALKMFQKSKSLLPLYADLYHLGGLIHLEKRDLAQAVACFQKALSLPEPPSFYSSVDGVRGYRTFLELGKIAEINGSPTEALEYYTRSFKENPDFTPALEKLILLLNPYRDPNRVKAYLEQIADLTTPEASLKLGAVLYRHSAYQLAWEYLETGSASPEAPPDLEIWKADCLFQQGQVEAAFSKLAGFRPEDPLYLMAAFHELIYFWLQQNHTKVDDLRAVLSIRNLSPDTQAIIALLQTTLNHLQSQDQSPPASAAETCPPRFGAEGIALFNHLLLRALDFKTIELADQWVKELGPELTIINAPNLGQIYQNFGYTAPAQYYFNLVPQ
jgi:glycosyltransferase involved in cell wall biosynthesis